MTLHELDSAQSVEAFKSNNANTLICFSATWCGPCKQSKPRLVELAATYEKDPTRDLVVGIVYEHTLGDSISTYNVKAFPTYVLFTTNGLVEHGRVEGVRFEDIENMVEDAGCKKSFGAGHSLGGGGDIGANGVEDARARRLARFGIKPEPIPDASSSTVESVSPASNDVDMATSEAAVAEASPDVEMDDIDNPKKKVMSEDVTMVDPTDSLSKEDINTLTTVMGFSIIRAQKGLLNSTTGVEGAVEWLLDHQEDADIDTPIQAIASTDQSNKCNPCTDEPTQIAQSYKCNQCSKIFSNMANLELHANKTGHSDFEESTEKVKPLTAAEKEAKIAEIKTLLKAKRDERLKVEKDESIDREKQRRFMGKEMGKTREEMEHEKRIRDAYMRKKEKEESKRERARIKMEIEKDKMERKANKGKLTSKLGVNGYNPDAIQYDVGDACEGEDSSATNVAQPVSKPKASVAKLDDYISKVASYRAGGDGGKCLKILLAYVKNVIDHPTEVKYQSINTENKAYRTKVKPFIGAKSLLLAVGFAPNENGDALVLSGKDEGDNVDMDILTQARVKLEAAFTAY